jgi:SAM-dependent methyltransferase
MSALRAIAQRLPPFAPHVLHRAIQASATVPGMVRFIRDRRQYVGMSGAEQLRWRDTLPVVSDRLTTTPFDAHYLHQDTWAAQRVAETRPAEHVDVGSRVDFACFLTALTKVTFIDIRPLAAEITGLSSVAGSVLALPFTDQSVDSLSCLHVAEHIGLGRYGDPLDPAGSRKAIAELQRVLAPGGRLLFSVPVGLPRVCFNAHRIHDPREVRALFDELELLEFAGVDDTGSFRRNRSLDELARESYACGMYHFVRAGREHARR